MATSFSYVLFTRNRHKDGSIPVKIRMIHERTARYFPTTIVVTKDQLDKKGVKIKDVRLTDSLDALVKEYRIAASLIPHAQYLTANEMANAIRDAMKRSKAFRLDFFEFADSKIQGMKPKTAEVYRTSMNALKRFVGSDTLDISDINHRFILKFKLFLENEPAITYNKLTYKEKKPGCRAISLYLSNVRAMYNRAIEEYNDEDYTPIKPIRFKKSTIPPQPETEHRVLTKEQMKKIMAYEPTRITEQIAKDVFLLSFYLVGMNTVDIYGLLKSDMKNGIITYNRTKTSSRRQDKAMMQVKVEPEAEHLINKNASTYGDQLLNFSNRYANAHSFNQAVNEHLKEILPGLTTYHARHTWSTIAKNDCDVDFDTVHFALNHAKDKEGKLTEIYIKRDFSKIWEANRKVIDFVTK